MDAKFNVRKVEPIGQREALAFVDYSREAQLRGKRNGLEKILLPEYPPSPRGEALHHLRMDLGLSLREGIAVSGLAAVEYSGLEHGSFTLADPADWDRLEKALTEARAEKARFTR